MNEIERRDVLGIGVAGILLTNAAATTAAPLEPLASQLITSVRIEVSSAIEQGVVDGKRKRFIPITGGSFAGPKMNGVVLAGGGDWQAIHEDGLTEIFARYSLRTDDGVTIAITNPGVRVATPDVIRRLVNGEDVPPSQYYFRTTPSFEVAAGPYDWLRRKVFVGRAIRKPDHVLMDVFEIA